MVLIMLYVGFKVFSSLAHSETCFHIPLISPLSSSVTLHLKSTVISNQSVVHDSSGYEIQCSNFCEFPRHKLTTPISKCTKFDKASTTETWPSQRIITVQIQCSLHFFSCGLIPHLIGYCTFKR